MDIYMLYNVAKTHGKYKSVSVGYTAHGNMLNLYTNAVTGVLLISNSIEIPTIKETCSDNQNRYIVPQYTQETNMDIDWLHLLNSKPISEWLLNGSAATICLCLITEDELSILDIKKLEESFSKRIVILDCVEKEIMYLFEKAGWNTLPPCI